MPSSPPTTPSIPITEHVLSKRSYAQDRDTFIFWPMKPAHMAIGFNQKQIPLTSARIHRWVRLLDPETCPWDLRPVSVQKRGVLRYTVSPAARVIPPSDTSPLPPGDYGMFMVHETWKSRGYPLCDLPGIDSFNMMKLEAEKTPGRGHGLVGDAIKLYTFPASFDRSIRLRDKVCYITGTSPSDGDLDLCWIFPPPWAYKLNETRVPYAHDFPPFVTVANACLMRRDLIDLFHDNAFGVDVDDDYRIVIFRDIGTVTLSSHLPKHHRPALMGPEDNFLRNHFGWCLMVHTGGGDISEDYDSNAIHNGAEQLGLSGDEYDLAPMDDIRWNSVLGKALWENYMNNVLFNALHEQKESQKGELKGDEWKEGEWWGGGSQEEEPQDGPQEGELQDELVNGPWAGWKGASSREILEAEWPSGVQV